MIWDSRARSKSLHPVAEESPKVSFTRRRFKAAESSVGRKDRANEAAQRLLAE